MKRGHIQVGKRQREILQILQDDDEWTHGELWNDGGMWTVSSVDAGGVRFGRRAQAAPCIRLFERGFVYCARIEAGMGVYGTDRAVYVLTKKGERV